MGGRGATSSQVSKNIVSYMSGYKASDRSPDDWNNIEGRKKWMSDEAQQGCEPDFVIFGGYTFPELSERDILPALFHYCPGNRNLDTEEYVPLSILPFPGLEKT